MTTTPPRVVPLAVQPKHDVPPQAYHVTADNIAEIGSILSLTPTHMHGGVLSGARLEIPFERRYNLASSVGEDDVIVKHPTTVRDLEVLPHWKFTQQYETADRDLVDMVVSEEFPDAHAWALIADTPDGVRIIPGRNASGTLIVGMAQKIARGRS